MTYLTKQIGWNLNLNDPVRICLQWAENCKSKLLWPACFEVYSIEWVQANSLLEFSIQFALNEHLNKTDIFLELNPESFIFFFSLANADPSLL